MKVNRIQTIKFNLEQDEKRIKNAKKIDIWTLVLREYKLAVLYKARESKENVDFSIRIN